MYERKKYVEPVMDVTDIGLMKKFEFNDDNIAKAREVLTHYPKNQSKAAILPVLYLVQEQLGWISPDAMEYVATFLNIPVMHVREVVSFYTMFRTTKEGKYVIQVCRTTPCWLCGSDNIRNRIIRMLGINLGETTKNGLFTLKEVECLGACSDAPVVQINNDLYERLTEDKIQSILSCLPDSHE